MLRLFENLPVELVGTNVLRFLSIKDIVNLERASGSKKSHQLFLCWIPYYPSVVLYFYIDFKKTTMLALRWFAKRRCKISYLNMWLSNDNPVLQIENLQVDSFHLRIPSNIRLESFKPLLENEIGYKVRNIYIEGGQNMEVIEQLCVYTRNVKQLTLRYSDTWITRDVFKNWKLDEISFFGLNITADLILLIAKTCSELKSIKLDPYTVNDAVVMAVAQHCPKLETLHLTSRNLTWTSLLALSERGLPLIKLKLPYIPNIPDRDIARRCCHAFSRISHLSSNDINDLYIDILIPYMTGLNSIDIYCDDCTYIPLLTQHCQKLTKINIHENNNRYNEDILLLCCANPLLQEFSVYGRGGAGFTDTEFVQLIHACPQLHTLYLPYATEITDTGILALSEHCSALQMLTIYRCQKITEAAVLQLLQCCRKLAKMKVSNNSLSEETWWQLDRNKRVIRTNLGNVL